MRDPVDHLTFELDLEPVSDQVDLLINGFVPSARALSRGSPAGDESPSCARLALVTPDSAVAPSRVSEVSAVLLRPLRP